MAVYQVLPHGREPDSDGFTVAMVERGGRTVPIMVYATEAEANEAKRSLERAAHSGADG